ncbi:MAG: hypothetical protein ABIK86_07665 [candidate division WOR-3 bacterium]
MKRVAKTVLRLAKAHWRAFFLGLLMTLFALWMVHIDARLRSIQMELSFIGSEVSQIESDVSSIESDVSSLESDVSSIELNMALSPYR